MPFITGILGKIIPFFNFGGKQGLKGSILPFLIVGGLIFYSFTSYKEGVQLRQSQMVERIKLEEREKVSLELQLSQKDSAIDELNNSIASLRRQNELSKRVEAELKDKVSEISARLDVARRDMPEHLVKQGNKEVSDYLKSGLKRLHEIEYSDEKSKE